MNDSGQGALQEVTGSCIVVSFMENLS